jgi:hypothetical protein
MYPPPEWLQAWARENPKQAAFLLLFGAAQVGFVIWIVASDGCR